MEGMLAFGVVVFFASGAALLAIESHIFTERVRVPAPAFFLAAAALVVHFIPSVTEPSAQRSSTS